MKPNRWNRFLGALHGTSVSSALVVGFVGLSAGSASSATLTWDISPGTVGVGNGAVTGGTGAWDVTPSLGNWTVDAGANNIAWVNNPTPDGAIFSGTGGTVTQAGVVANNITFSGTGYTLTGGTLTLGGVAPKITATVDATVSSVLAGTAGMIKDGAGILTLPTKATYTGGTIVNAGVLNLSGGGGASGTIRGNLDLNNGASLRINTGDATGYNTGADRIGVFNINAGSNLHVNVTNNQTLGSAVINMTGSTVTGVSGSNLDFFAGSSALNTLASSTTSTFSGPRLNIRQTAGVTLTVASGTTPTGIDLDINSVVGSNGSFATAPLIKAGTGTVRLNAVNTYTGPTTINAGTFILGPAATAPSSDFTVNGSTTLRLASTGKTLKSLTLNTGSTLAPAVRKTFTNTVTGALATNGSITIKPEFLDTPATADVYNIATAASSSGAPTFTVDTTAYPSTRIAATAAVTGNILQLTIGTGAASLIWNNNTASGIWDLNSALNFDNAGSPDVFKSLDGVTFNGTAPGTITLAGSLAPGSVTVNSTAGSDYSFAGSGSLSNGTLTKAGTSTLTVSTSNTHGSTVINDGVLVANAPNATGTGVTIINGGTLNAASAGSAGSGTLTLAGGTLSIGNATALGVIPLTLTGGSFENTSGSPLTLPNPQTWNGNFAFNGSQDVTATGNIALTGNTGIEVIANTLTAGGVISGAFSLSKSGAGILRLNAAHSYSGATNVSGPGLLWVTNTLRNTSGINVGIGSTLELGATNIFVDGHGTAIANGRVITVNGGTLLMNNLADFRFGNVTLNDGATWTSNRGLANYDALLANTASGAATITVGGTGTSTMNGAAGCGIHLVGVQNFNVADSSGNANADLNVNMILGNQGTTGGAAGGIDKTGAGTMVLNAVNNFAGTTTINDGTLVIGAAGSANASAFTVNAATLQSDATEKTVVALTVNNGASLALAAKKLESFRVTGALNTSGTVTLKPLFADTPATGDVYDYIAAGTFTSGATYTVDMSSRGATRVTATAAPDLGQYLVLTIGTGAANLTWNNNAATGIWNHNTDANFDNSGSPDVFKTYDAVTFGDTAAGTVNLAGTLYPGTVTVDSTADYTFAGSGALGGGTLVKLGTSTLNLTTAQSPAGVTLSAGTLNVAHPAALGSGRVTLTGGLFNNGTASALTLANAQTWDTAATFTGSDLTISGPVTLATSTDVTVGPASLTVSGAVTGLGTTLVKQGTGAMTLNGAAASAIGGGIDVKNGSLVIATQTGAALLAIGGSGNPASVLIDGNQQANRLANAATVTIGNLGTFSLNGVNALPNHANSCNFTVEAGGLLTVTSGGSPAIGVDAGSHHHIGNLNLNGGTVTFPYSGAGTSYSTESVQINGDIVVGGSVPSTITFGAGATTGNSGLAIDDEPCLITVNDVTGNADADLIIAAEIENSDTGAGSITKLGSGTMALSGNIVHSHTGTTTVSAGTLEATGTMPGPLVVEAAGTIAPGASAGSFGTGNTTISGIYDCEIDGGNVDTLTVTGDLVLTGGTLDLSVLGGGATEATYVIATYTGTLTGNFATVNGLPSGYSVKYNGSLKRIEVTNVADAYGSWESDNGIGGAGAEIDSDNDGIDNGIEFVIGGDPSGPGSSSSALLPTVTIDATYLNFTFRRTDDSASYNPGVEYGSTLTGWTDAVGGVGGVVINEINNGFGAGIDSVEVKIPRSLTSDPEFFARLKVTIP